MDNWHGVWSLGRVKWGPDWPFSRIGGLSRYGWENDHTSIDSEHNHYYRCRISVRALGGSDFANHSPIASWRCPLEVFLQRKVS